MKFFEQVYEITKKIPRGKVMTYGQIADIMGTKDARKVGFALHANKDLKVPCHRVVNKDGEVAQNFSFGDYREHKKRLMEEGVEFRSERRLDLVKYQVKSR